MGPNLGAVGASGFGHATINGCVIDSPNNRVLATVSGSSDMNVGGNYDIVMAFDLTTGNRTVISGNWTDPKTGDFTTGNGPAFGGVGGIQPAPGGGYYVLSATTGGSQLFQMSPSGDRSIVWDGTLGAAGACPYPNDTTFHTDIYGAFAVGSNGTVYVTGGNSFAVYTIQNGKCSVLTLDDSTDPSLNHGKGPNPPAAIADALMTPTGGLFANDGNVGGGALYQVDTTSGSWTLVSNAQAGVGGGANVGIGGVMTFSKGLLWTAGNGMRSVDPVSGNRTSYPAPTNIEAGPPVEGVGCLQPFPNQSYFVVSSSLGGDFDALLLFEPSSGLSMVLSY